MIVCSAKYVFAAFIVVAFVCSVGCDEASPYDQAFDFGEVQEADQERLQWRTVGDETIAVLPLDDEKLAKAIAEARATADEARLRWTHSKEAERQNWAIKWAAPCVERQDAADVEYLWVRPTHWSPFRIEGVLLNAPLRELLAPAVRGDAVAFPIEQLADWMHYQRTETGVEHTGGFTVDALEAANE